MSDWLDWIFLGVGLVGTGSLFAGALVAWKRHPAHILMCLGGFLGFGGMLGLVTFEELLPAIIGAFPSWMETGSMIGGLAFFGGWLVFGPAYLWMQLVARRERAQRAVEAQIMAPRGEA